MPIRVVDAQTGAVVELPDDDAYTRLADGSALPEGGGRLRVVGQDGRTGTVEASSLPDAVRRGFRLYEGSAQQTTDDRNRDMDAVLGPAAGTPLESGLALGAAGLRGTTATLGTTAAGLLGREVLGDDRVTERLDTLADRNPIADVTGDVAGTLGTLLIPGAGAARGSGLLARGLRTLGAPVRGIEALGTLAERGVVGATGGTARTALGRMAQQTLSRTVQGGVEGVAEGVVRELSDQALHEGRPDEYAERVLAAARTGALWGGGAGGLLGGGASVLGEGARGLAGIGGGVLRRAWRAGVGTELDEGVSELAAYTLGDAMGNLGPRGQEARRVILQGDAVLDEGARDAVAALNELERVYGAGRHLQHGRPDRSRVARMVRGDLGQALNMGRAGDDAVGAALRAAEEARAVGEELMQPGLYSPAAAARGRALALQAEQQIIELRRRLGQAAPAPGTVVDDGVGQMPTLPGAPQPPRPAPGRPRAPNHRTDVDGNIDRDLLTEWGNEPTFDADTLVRQRRGARTDIAGMGEEGNEILRDALAGAGPGTEVDDLASRIARGERGTLVEDPRTFVSSPGTFVSSPGTFVDEVGTFVDDAGRTLPADGPGRSMGGDTLSSTATAAVGPRTIPDVLPQNQDLDELVRRAQQAYAGRDLRTVRPGNRAAGAVDPMAATIRPGAQRAAVPARAAASLNLPPLQPLGLGRRMNADDVAHAYVGVDRLGRELSRLGSALEDIDPDAARRIADIQQGHFRPLMQSERMWGRRIVESQRGLANAIDAFQQNRRAFERRFLSDVEARPGQRAVDPARVRAFLERAGTASSDLDAKVFRDLIESQARLADALAGHGGNASSREAAARALKALDDAERRASVLNQYRALVQDAQFSGQGYAARAGARLVGGAVGHALGGLPGAVVGAGVGGAITAATSPAARLRMLAMVDRLSSKVDDRIRNSVRTFVRRATGSARRVGRAVRGTTTRAGRLASPEAFNERMEQLREARSSDQALQQRLAEATRDLDEHAPGVRDAVHTAALRGIGFLSARTPTPTGMQGTLMPGVTGRPRYLEQDRIRFMSYARIVDNPMAALDDLEDGRLNMETVEALKEVYPSLYQAVVQETMSELAQRAERGHRLSYADRTQLSLLLGTPTDPTLTPEFIAMFQRTFAMAGQRRQTTSSPRPISDTLSTSLRTASQSLEARQAGT
jgi:hypothetical protein